MEFPAVEGPSLRESVCGKDERVQVDPMTSPPYKWICSLLIESASGVKYRGSGFKIYLPDVDRTAIVTSGHCTYIKGAYATKITVTFPGEYSVNVGPDDIYASPEYIKTGDADHDYGLILLSRNSDGGFGWSAIISDEELKNRLVTNCGYPAEKPPVTMWITGGAITETTPNRIYYMNDTMGGQSGSPVYTWYGGFWTVIAVHSYGGCPNSAPRFTSQMISRFLERMNGLQKKSLRSVAFPDVYLRCDGTRVKERKEPGGGTVNCKYQPPSSWESFYIYPVEMTPSLTPQTNDTTHKVYKVAIESAHFRHVFIRMDSQGMSRFMQTGEGEVNCQFQTASTSWESYFLRQETNGSYSFRNVQFPHCYIRLDGTGVNPYRGVNPYPGVNRYRGVNSRSDRGGGTVNCQYYDDRDDPASSWESFHMEEH